MVGIAFVYAYVTVIAPDFMVKRSVTAEPIVASEAVPSNTFVPKFRDLPNFDEIKYRKPSGKLIELLEDGIYRRSDLVAKNGEKWLVMIGKGDHSQLYVRRANVKLLNSISWLGDEKDAQLTFDGLWGDRIIALRSVRNVKEGPITTLFLKKLYAEDKNGLPDHEEISTDYIRDFFLSGNKYSLYTAIGSTRDGTTAAVLVLETEGKQQIIRQVKHVERDRDIFGSLLWVGDMDRDGKLDIYLDEFNGIGFTATELHLSSHADPGKLVGLAADFGMPGC
ncbi:MAG: hypothetical protein AB7Q37_07470 [Pyrinomonadaceae bacterium]